MTPFERDVWMTSRKRVRAGDGREFFGAQADVKVNLNEILASPYKTGDASKLLGSEHSCGFYIARFLLQSKHLFE